MALWSGCAAPRLVARGNPVYVGPKFLTGAASRVAAAVNRPARGRSGEAVETGPLKRRGRDKFGFRCQCGRRSMHKLLGSRQEPGACEEAMSRRAELLIGALSWLLTLGLIAAIIGEAFR